MYFTSISKFLVYCLHPFMKIWQNIIRILQDQDQLIYSAFRWCINLSLF